MVLFLPPTQTREDTEVGILTSLMQLYICTRFSLQSRTIDILTLASSQSDRNNTRNELFMFMISSWSPAWNCFDNYLVCSWQCLTQIFCSPHHPDKNYIASLQYKTFKSSESEGWNSVSVSTNSIISFFLKNNIYL